MDLPLATPNGWMDGELFVKTMQHFIEHTNSSKENPSLLILDNHESHICIQALNLAKERDYPHSSTAFNWEIAAIRCWHFWTF